MQVARSRRVRIRVKRRGRVVLALFIAVALVLGLPQIFLAGAAEPGDGLVTVVVKAGDTLWDLARTYGPADADPRYTVHRIRELNGLAGATIRPGQQLLIPTR